MDLWPWLSRSACWLLGAEWKAHQLVAFAVLTAGTRIQHIFFSFQVALQGTGPGMSWIFQHRHSESYPSFGVGPPGLRDYEMHVCMYVSK